jgi:terminase small subunit-like protein
VREVDRAAVPWRGPSPNGSPIINNHEALETITRHARGDIRKLFKNNRLLPISEWPEDVADCVKAIRPTRFGTAIVFYDKLKACELMAIAGGKVQHKFDRAHKFDHLLCLGAEPPVGDDE